MTDQIHPFVAARGEAELLTVKEEYHDVLWGNVLRLIDDALNRGETELPRVLKIVEAAWRNMTPEPADGIAFGEKVRIPRAALIGGRQALRNRTFAAACRDNTKLIVELGSGWGNNLAEAYLAGCAASAEYWGLELSKEGRAATTRLASLKGAPAVLKSAPFNFFEPDYSALPDCPDGHVLIFSCHAIEQVQQLKREVFTRLLDRYPRISGIHHEPVGWQIRAQKGLPPASVGATKENSARTAYNENLWDTLCALEGDGRIRITHAEPDIIGHKLKNASTYIRWESH